MYDVEGLEKEWKKYKVKQRKPWIVSAMLVSLIILFIVYKTEFASMVSGYSHDINQSVIKQKIEENNTSLKPFVPTLVEPIEESNQSVQEKPSLPSDDESNLSIEENESDPSMMVEVAQEEIQSEPEHQRKYLKIIVTDMYPKHQEESKKTTQHKREKNIAQSKASSAKSPNVSDSLSLARKYYKNGDYTSAQKWALVTNNLNNNIEESWLIFAKSKAKMGERSEAEKILTTYIKQTGSSQAKALLLEIKKSKF